jgi:hypothetical protein
MKSKVASILLLIVGFIAFIVIYRVFISGTGLIGYLYTFLLFMFLQVIGMYVTSLMVRGRREALPLPNHEELIAATDPVLYLRSFKDDRVSEAVRGVSITDVTTYRSASFVTDEEKLIAELRSIGKVVAIGDPREKLPQLGAERVFVDGSDEEWQQVVLGWMDRARLVVLRVGGTKGLLWEVQEAAKRVRPEQLLLLVPADEHLYEKCRTTMKDRGLPHLPSYAAKFDIGSTIGHGGLAALISFASDWTAQFVAFKDENGLRSALQPIVQRLRPAGND